MGPMDNRNKELGTKEKIHFHPEQVKYLESMYNRVVMPPTATQAEMNHYFGQQSVLEFIKTRVRL